MLFLGWQCHAKGKRSCIGNAADLYEWDGERKVLGDRDGEEVAVEARRMIVDVADDNDNAK